MAIKKLIEVALPLDKINEACAREKSIRHGHPSTLHLWWARRPLAAARAVIWASLVDDPSSHPELFPTEEDQHQERERLFAILEKLVIWENSNNQDVLDATKKEILKYNHGEFPTLLDPFAGGGAIPLEAQRLGLKAIAHDLNPVAVMINKAMIEIPPRFSGTPPVNPDARRTTLNNTTGWVGVKGLAEDVRYYGEWMKEKAYEKIGHLYPKVQLPPEEGGGEATVIAWIWARTVKCPNPACECEMPLASSFVLSKKKGHEAWIEPIIQNKIIRYRVHYGKCPKEKQSIKLNKGASFKCINCGAVTEKNYIHDEFIAHRNGTQLMAIVAEGKKGRIYLSPTEKQGQIALSAIPEWVPEEQMNTKTPDLVSGRGYGITMWKELFTNRQLTALTTFSSLISDVIAKVEEDALAAGMENDGKGLDAGGKGAKAYGEAVGVYLAFLVDQIANHSSSVCGWNAPNEQMRNTFGRQAIPMVWDYAECNIFSHSSGSYESLFKRMWEAFESLGNGKIGQAEQFDAQCDCGVHNIMVSTDPPYYDNIGYADLSDFFYIWMRQSLKNIYPDLFSTMLVPKAEELIATPYRHEGSKEKAKKFFENGMLETCKQIYKYTKNDIPVTIYYAYKQSDFNPSGDASGWESMLNAIICAGFAITGTWPMRTEKQGRMIENGTNALASSIVLVCRKRPENAPQTSRRNLIAQLRRELHPALKKLQESNIAPVDLAQAAIGPGMGVFSRYCSVLEADGTEMTVRSALQIINEQVDAYFNEQVGSMDTESRFCVDLYLQKAYEDIPYGEAEILANAKGALIPKMVEHKVLYAKAGKVHLVKREQLPSVVVLDEHNIWLLTQQLTFAMEEGGIEACAQKVSSLYGNNAERAKDLAYRLYTVAEQKGWTSEAFAYNALVVSWPDIQSKAAELKKLKPEQMDLFDTDDLT
jgi:putative DNA methylase